VTSVVSSRQGSRTEMQRTSSDNSSVVGTRLQTFSMKKTISLEDLSACNPKDVSRNNPRECGVSAALEVALVAVSSMMTMISSAAGALEAASVDPACSVRCRWEEVVEASRAFNHLA